MVVGVVGQCLQVGCVQCVGSGILGVVGLVEVMGKQDLVVLVMVVDGCCQVGVMGGVQVQVMECSGSWGYNYICQYGGF